MCYSDPAKPYAMPLAVEQTREGLLSLTFTLVLGKVTTMRGGLHSTGGLGYDLRRPVCDPNVLVGDHSRCIHLAGNPHSANSPQLSGFGSHILAVLPGPLLWGRASDGGRCWHAASVIPLFCLACEGVQLDVLGLSDFWKHMRLPPATARWNHLVQGGMRPGPVQMPPGIPASQVWRRQTLLVSPRDHRCG
jgi:hypothetical protein